MITMTDIAHKAGVSRATVSHVLSAYQGKNVRIPDATRQRVLETAAELGYRPNQLARSVASGKTRMIGYLVMEADYEPCWNTLVGALTEAETLGFTLKVLSVTRETLAERVQQCIELRLSGLIVRVIGDKSVIFQEANRAQIPVVCVDEGVTQDFGATIAADDAIGCRDAIEHLIQFGHRRIGFISSGFPQRFKASAADIGTVRELSFLQEMQARGLAVPAGYIVYETMSVFGPYSEVEEFDQSVLAATQSLLSHPEGRPTAIFCWRDETAMIAIRACREQGLRVPEDISVVGFSDIRSAHFFDPPLSTVKSPWNEMGRRAVLQVCERINEEFDPQPNTHLVPTGFVARKSTGPVPTISDD